MHLNFIQIDNKKEKKIIEKESGKNSEISIIFKMLQKKYM